MNRLFKFEIQHESISGSLDITPSTYGWEDIEMKLERHKDFYSLVELVETPLIFRAESKETILSIIDTYGVDTTVSIDIAISEDVGETYDNIFTGTLQLVDKELIYEGSLKKEVRIPIIQNEFWQIFSNRKETSVQVGSSIDLDGNTRESFTKKVFNLPSQIVRYRYYAYNNSNANRSLGGSGRYIYHQFGFQNEEVNEVDGFTYEPEHAIYFQLDETDLTPINGDRYVFKAENKGTLKCTFTIGYDDVGLQYTLTSQNSGATDAFTCAICMYKNDQQIPFSGLVQGGNLNGLSSVTITFDAGTYTQNVSVEEGDKIYFVTYFHTLTDDPDFGGLVVAAPATDSKRIGLDLQFETVFDDTTCDTFMLHETGHSICNSITGQDGAFYSGYLGNTVTQNRNYNQNGDGSFMVLTTGLNLRGKSFDDKPLYMSFMDWWNGINPIQSLALGYEKIDGVDTIRVELKEHFFQSTPSLTLLNIDDLVEMEDVNSYFKSIEIGFKKWKSEELGALDDPQAKHKYATRFKTLGTDIKLLSEFYMASIGIEVTRRKDIKETEDWKLDNDIIAIGTEITSGSSNPELDEGFTTINNLINSDKRYNIRYTPKRSLLRWGAWLSMGLTKYPGSLYRFVGGEGNYDMETVMDSGRGDYLSLLIAENDDIEWDYTDIYGSSANGQIPFQTPTFYKFSYPLTSDQWNTIRNNKKNSISISESGSNPFTVYIETAEWSPSTGICQFQVKKRYDIGAIAVPL